MGWGLGPLSYSFRVPLIARVHAFLIREQRQLN
jgi:hypothetical protein